MGNHGKTGPRARFFHLSPLVRPILAPPQPGQSPAPRRAAKFFGISWAVGRDQGKTRYSVHGAVNGAFPSISSARHHQMLRCRGCADKISPVSACIFPLLPMITHVIPFLTETSWEQKAGAAEDPEQAKKTGFIQAPSPSKLKRSGAQASRHLPQVASAAGRPAMGQTADRAVAAARSAFSISGARQPHEGAARLW